MRWKMSRLCLGEFWEVHTCATSVLSTQVHTGAAKPGAWGPATGAFLCRLTAVPSWLITFNISLLFTHQQQYCSCTSSIFRLLRVLRVVVTVREVPGRTTCIHEHKRIRTLPTHAQKQLVSDHILSPFAKPLPPPSLPPSPSYTLDVSLLCWWIGAEEKAGRLDTELLMQSSYTNSSCAWSASTSTGERGIDGTDAAFDSHSNPPPCPLPSGLTNTATIQCKYRHITIQLTGSTTEYLMKKAYKSINNKLCMLWLCSDHRYVSYLKLIKWPLRLRRPNLS